MRYLSLRKRRRHCSRL